MNLLNIVIVYPYSVLVLILGKHFKQPSKSEALSAGAKFIS